MSSPGEPLLAAAVLAAGGSTRFADGSKQLAELRGRPLVASAVDAPLAVAEFAAVFVVSGAVDLNGVLPDGAIVLDNPRWAEGQATSLGVAVHAARVGGFDALVVGLADQPFVGADAWRSLAAPRPSARSSWPPTVVTAATRFASPRRSGHCCPTAATREPGC